MNILYIGNSNSIHDLKWIEHLKENFNIKPFFISEKEYVFHPNFSNLKNEVVIGKRLKPFSFFYFWNTLINIWNLNLFIQKNKIDLVHIFIGTNHVIPSFFFIKKLIITTRGTDVLNTLFNLSKSRRIIDKLNFKILKFYYQNAFQVTSTSISQINLLQKLINFKKPPIIVRTGIPIRKIIDTANKLNQHQKDIIFFPRGIHQNYNPMLSIKAILNLPLDIIIKFQFHFIKGINYDIDLYTKMQKALSSNNISYKFTEYCNSQMLYKYMIQSKLIVMNPVSDGTPNSALEAMLLKKPIIVGNCNYDEDIFNDKTVFKLKSNNPLDLKDLIIKALSYNNHERIELAYLTVQEKASQIIEMEKIHQLYLDCISKN